MGVLFEGGRDYCEDVRHCQEQLNNIKKTLKFPRNYLGSFLGSNSLMLSLLSESNCFIWSFMQTGTMH